MPPIPLEVVPTVSNGQRIRLSQSKFDTQWCWTEPSRRRRSRGDHLLSTVLAELLDITVPLEALRAACRRVAPALGHRLPAFGCVRITAGVESVLVEAQNDSQSFGSSFQLAEPTQQVQVAISGHTLGRFLDVAEGPDVRLTSGADTERVVVRAGVAELTLSVMAAEEWPVLDLSYESRTELSPALLGWIRRVLFAAHHDPDRGVLAGVGFSKSGVVASDNERLARVLAEFPISDCVVPAPFLVAVLKSATSDQGLTIDLRPGRVTLRDKSGYWSSPLIEIPYPNVSRLFTAPVTGSLRLDRQRFKKGLERVSVVPSASSVQITRLSGSEVLLSTGDDETGHVEERVECVAEGFEEACFVLTHLLDAVAAVDVGTFELRLAGELRPAVIPGTSVMQAVLPRRCDDVQSGVSPKAST